MPTPTDRKYLPTHEWHKLEGDTVTIGITQFAADELTDVTYVKLPAVGQAVRPGQPIGEVESVKATSELYCGVSGTVAAVNEELKTNPALVNTDPFQRGWIVKIKVAPNNDSKSLLSAEDYQKKIGQ